MREWAKLSIAIDFISAKLIHVFYLVPPLWNEISGEEGVINAIFSKIFTKREFDRLKLGMNIPLDCWHKLEYTTMVNARIW